MFSGSVEIKPLGREMDTASFDCGDADLNAFLKADAIAHQEALLATTMVALTPEGKIAGYCARSCDAVKLSEDEREIFDARKRYSEYPALKIGRMAIDKQFQHKGLGAYLLSVSAGIALKHNDKTGCRFLTVDAYPVANAFYEKNGFTNNLLKNKPGRHTVSKRFDLLNPKPQAESNALR